MAIGCAKGVWFGFRHDPRCECVHACHWVWTDEDITAVRRVLHLKLVTQCAILENFGIFLVLADGVSTAPCLRHM
jgi:hypothetical protein